VIFVPWRGNDADIDSAVILGGDHRARIGLHVIVTATRYFCPRRTRHRNNQAVFLRYGAP
jgi:hypothetical protein